MLGLEGLEWKTTLSFSLMEDDLKYFCEWKATSNIFVYSFHLEPCETCCITCLYWGQCCALSRTTPPSACTPAWGTANGSKPHPSPPRSWSAASIEIICSCFANIPNINITYHNSSNQQLLHVFKVMRNHFCMGSNSHVRKVLLDIETKPVLDMLVLLATWLGK